MTWLSICVKALVYATTLMAIGSVLSVLFLRSLPLAEVRSLGRHAAGFALAAAFLSVLRLPIRASFLTGGTWAGAVDPMMLNMVTGSPLGTAVALRLVGLALIPSILLAGNTGRWLAAIGMVLAATSFAMRGHALAEPRALLGLLLTAHILGLAFWTGALLPLFRTASRPPTEVAGALAEEFGRKAIWVVGGLAFAGLAMFALLTGGPSTLFTSTYGQFFTLKLGLFAIVLALAAWNRFRLTAALQASAPGAGRALRRSIAVEATFIALILVVTAILSTISAPHRPSQAAAEPGGINTPPHTDTREGKA